MKQDKCKVFSNLITLCIRVVIRVIQPKRLNVISLRQSEADNLKPSTFSNKIFLLSTLLEMESIKSDYNTQLITLTMITISGAHFILNISLLGANRKLQLNPTLLKMY